MIIRVTAPAGGLQYPAQKEANAKPVVLSFVITEKHAVKFDGPEMNFDDKIRWYLTARKPQRMYTMRILTPASIVRQITRLTQTCRAYILRILIYTTT